MAVGRWSWVVQASVQTYLVSYSFGGIGLIKYITPGTPCRDLLC